MVWPRRLTERLAQASEADAIKQCCLTGGPDEQVDPADRLLVFDIIARL